VFLVVLNFFILFEMAVLKNYPCQFALGMFFTHLVLLGIVSYKYLQYLGLQVSNFVSTIRRCRLIFVFGQGDILNHRDFLKMLKNSLFREVVIQIGN
jgi:hypothetical protein